MTNQLSNINLFHRVLKNEENFIIIKYFIITKEIFYFNLQMLTLPNTGLKILSAAGKDDENT